MSDTIESLRAELDASMQNVERFAQAMAGLAQERDDAMERANRALDRVRVLDEALKACGVFFTPIERLKGWNEYKEDAARRRAAALTAAPSEEPDDTAMLDWLEKQDCWIGVSGEYELAARIYAGGGYSTTVRQAIRAAMRAESEGGR